MRKRGPDSEGKRGKKGEMHTHTTSIDNVVISKIRDISRGHNSHVLSSIAIIKEGFISVCLDGGSGKEDYQ